MIGSEDQLCDFLMARAQTDMRFLWLFEHVTFEDLSQDRIRNFAELAGANLSYLTSDVWSRMSRRLELTPTSVGSDARVVNDTQVVVSDAQAIPTPTPNCDKEGSLPVRLMNIWRWLVKSICLFGACVIPTMLLARYILKSLPGLAALVSRPLK